MSLAVLIFSQPRPTLKERRMTAAVVGSPRWLAVIRVLGSLGRRIVTLCHGAVVSGCRVVELSGSRAVGSPRWAIGWSGGGAVGDRSSGWRAGRRASGRLSCRGRLCQLAAAHRPLIKPNPGGPARTPFGHAITGHGRRSGRAAPEPVP